MLLASAHPFLLQQKIFHKIRTHICTFCINWSGCTLKAAPCKKNSTHLLFSWDFSQPLQKRLLFSGQDTTTMRPRGTSVSDEQDVKKVPIRKERLKILKTAEKRERKSLFGFVVSSLVRVFSFPFFAFRSSVRSGLSAYLGMNLLFFSQNKSSSTMVRTMLPQHCRVLFSVPSSLYYVRFLYSVWPTTCHSVTHFCPAQFTSWNVTFLLLAPLKESTHRK